MCMYIVHSIYYTVKKNHQQSTKDIKEPNEVKLVPNGLSFYHYRNFAFSL